MDHRLQTAKRFIITDMKLIIRTIEVSWLIESLVHNNSGA